MKGVIIAVTLLLITGAAGVAWKEIRRERNAAEVVTAVAMDNVRTRAAIRAMEQRLAAAERDRAERSAAFARASQPAPVAKAKESSAGAVGVDEIYRRVREREKDPKVQAIRLASRRAQLLASHGVFFRKRGLTPSQIERFQDVVARTDEQNLDLNGILESEAEKHGSVSAETKAAVEKIRDRVKQEAETSRKEL